MTFGCGFPLSMGRDNTRHPGSPVVAEGSYQVAMGARGDDGAARGLKPAACANNPTEFGIRGWGQAPALERSGGLEVEATSYSNPANTPDSRVGNARAETGGGASTSVSAPRYSRSSSEVAWRNGPSLGIWLACENMERFFASNS